MSDIIERAEAALSYANCVYGPGFGVGQTARELMEQLVAELKAARTEIEHLKKKHREELVQAAVAGFKNGAGQY